MYACSALRNGSNVGSGWAGAVVGGSVGPHAAANMTLAAISVRQRLSMQPRFANTVPGGWDLGFGIWDLQGFVNRVIPNPNKSPIPNPKSLQGGEERPHPIDFGALIGFDVGDEAEDVRRLRRARRVEQVADHRERAAVVLDHPLEKQLVERGPL